jgi:hypothetical protein
MKSPIVKMLGLIAGLLLSGTAEASGRWETLRAINWVENPTNHTRRGAFGELGPYQFRPQTWRMHTRKPFEWAVERVHADEVAVKHYEWLRRELQEAGIDPSPYNIALAWNSGLTAVTSGRVPRVTYDYANRVANLVAQQMARQEPGAMAKAERRSPKPAVINFDLNRAPRIVFNPAKAAFQLPAPLREPSVSGDIPVVRASSSTGILASALVSPRADKTFVIGAATAMFALPE